MQGEPPETNHWGAYESHLELIGLGRLPLPRLSIRPLFYWTLSRGTLQVTYRGPARNERILCILFGGPNRSFPMHSPSKKMELAQIAHLRVNACFVGSNPKAC